MTEDAIAQAARDQNRVTTLLAVTDDADLTPSLLRVDPATFRLKVDVSGGTGTSMIDDAAFTVGTTGITPTGAMFDDVTPDSVDEGDGGVLRMSARRELYVQIRDSAGNERGLKVDANGAIATTGAGGGTQYQEDVAHITGDTGTVALVVRKDTPANLSGTDGDYEALQVSGGRLWASATIDAALPAGTNAIGKLAANSGVDIGDVDVISVIPGTGATNLGKAADNASGATDTGVAVYAIRDDTLGALTPVEGDYVPLRVNSTGALHVTGGGGGTQYAVDDALGANPTGTLSVAIRDDALSALTPIEGDAIGLRVDANGALWTHDDALDAALAGSELQVDIVASLPTGTNAIGKLAANSGVDIGDVDVTSVIPGTGATNLGKAVDNIAGATDTGVLTVAIRDDALGALTPIEGDYVGLRVDANGALWTHDDALDAALAGTEIQVDVVASLPSGSNAIGKLTANSGVDIGDVTINNAAGASAVNIQDGGNSITIDGNVGITGTVDTELTTDDLDTGVGTDTRAVVGLVGTASGGGQLIPGSSTDGLLVNLGTNNDVTVTGTVTANAGTNLNTSALALETTTGSIKTAVELIDNAIAGTEMQVDVVASLPAGSNNIGDIDVLSVIPGTGATNLGKAIDDASGATDTGVAVLAIRDDTLSTLTPIESDYVPLRVNSTGALYVTGGGGGTQYAVDDALGANPTGTLSIAIRDDALSALTPLEGDAIGLRVDANGALWTHDDALDAALSGSELQVDIVAALPTGTNTIGKLGANSGVDIGDVDVTSVIAGTGATNLGKAVDAIAGATDTGVALLAVRDDALAALTPIEGDYVGLRTDANGALWTHDDALDAALAGTELQVDIVASLPSGSNAIGKLVANSGVDIGDVDVTSILPGTGATSLGKAEDATHTTGDVGVMLLTVRQNTAAALSGTDADYQPLITDGSGRVHTTDVSQDATNNLTATQIKPVAVSTYSYSRFADLGATATANVKASAGNVFSLWCQNENTADRYIQLHNTATTPAGGATPLYTFLMSGGDQIVIGTDFFGPAGANFSTGIAFAFSTTKDTYTAGTASEQSFICHYA